MAFRVELTAEAEADLQRAFAYIQADAPENAARWLHGLYDAVDSLQRFPERCGTAPEHEWTDFELRQYIYGRYRVLFTIQNDSVYVLHIRHGAREFLTPDELHKPQ